MQKVTYSSTCKTQYMYVHIMWVKVMDTNKSLDKNYVPHCTSQMQRPCTTNRHT